jgi:hypothetical protein
MGFTDNLGYENCMSKFVCLSNQRGSDGKDIQVAWRKVKICEK